MQIFSTHIYLYLNIAFELYRDSKTLEINLQEPAYTSLIRICHVRGSINLEIHI